jgi:hypothetical protein
MSQIIHNIKTYINTFHNPYHQVRVVHIKDKIDYTMICYEHYERDICIVVYNDNFIKINVDNHIHAICDGIKTFRSEIDRLNNPRYY